tara:strand:+ start:823 stop:960 length:138 start_codon:yes stop_codon:yes gene_type:complete
MARGRFGKKGEVTKDTRVRSEISTIRRGRRNASLKTVVAALISRR